MKKILRSLLLTVFSFLLLAGYGGEAPKKAETSVRPVGVSQVAKAAELPGEEQDVTGQRKALNGKDTMVKAEAGVPLVGVYLGEAETSAGEKIVLQEYGYNVVVITPLQDVTLAFYSSEPIMGKDRIEGWKLGKQLWKGKAAAGSRSISFKLSLPEIIPNIVMKVKTAQEEILWPVDNPGGGESFIQAFHLRTNPDTKKGGYPIIEPLK